MSRCAGDVFPNPCRSEAISLLHREIVVNGCKQGHGKWASLDLALKPRHANRFASEWRLHELMARVVPTAPAEHRVAINVFAGPAKCRDRPDINPSGRLVGKWQTHLSVRQKHLCPAPLAREAAVRGHRLNGGEGRIRNCRWPRPLMSLFWNCSASGWIRSSQHDHMSAFVAKNLERSLHGLHLARASRHWRINE
jgi:hypothetical protein